MTLEQWNVIKKCAKCEELSSVPLGLIIDSPWLPGYSGISTIDYFVDINKYLEVNMNVINEFSEIIFIPGFWVEYGMAIEPSGFGCLVNFFNDKTPTVQHVASNCKDASLLNSPNPTKDGLMPFALNIYKNIEKKVNDKGHKIKIVAARGPLTLASHLISVTNFLTDMKIEPENTHKLLKKTTQTVKNWLEAQANVLQEVEGILVLDDIVGFLSKEDYLEFAHPYLKEIFSSFQDNIIKMYHNDTNNSVYYDCLEELGINIFNFTHLVNIKEAKKLVGEKVCLMGNIPPLDTLVNGTEEQVKKDVKDCLENYSSNKGLLLSAGGGASPGTKKENIAALIKAVKDYNNL